MIHYIYKIIFLRGYPTGRYYFGKRSYPGDDISKDRYTGSGSFPKEYFKKYGKKEGDTYLKEILEVNPSFKINNDREKEIIGDKWKTDPLCMNKHIGGSGGNGETLLKRPVSQYDENGNFISSYPSIKSAHELTGVHMYSIVNCCKGNAASAGGYIWIYSEDKLHQYHLDRLHRTRYRVKQYDLSGNFIKDWKSAKEAATTLGLGEGNIRSVCEGRRINCGGFLWIYENDKLPEIKKKYFTGKRKVCLYDSNLNLLGTYESIQDATRKTGYSKNQIWKSCQNLNRYKKDFIWCYANQMPKTGTSPGTEIDQYDLNGNFIRHYVSINSAGVINKINVSGIRKHCINEKPYKGYVWKYSA